MAKKKYVVVGTGAIGTLVADQLADDGHSVIAISRYAGPSANPRVQHIVVPAVIRHTIPEANPALYLGLSLGITFPFNILFGIPLYVALATALLG